MHWPDDNDPMSTLILSNSDKHVIKALARKYTRHQSAWGADFIKGKGEGLIFLLHGMILMYILRTPLTPFRTTRNWEDLYCR